MVIDGSMGHMLLHYRDVEERRSKRGVDLDVSQAVEVN